MEDFPAATVSSRKFCEEKVRECNIYVGLIGVLYGSCPKKSQKSYTRLEYEAAKPLMPVLIHMAPNDFKLPHDLVESQKNANLQIAFRETLQDNHNVGRYEGWQSPEALAQHVTLSVREQIKNLERSTNKLKQFTGDHPEPAENQKLKAGLGRRFGLYPNFLPH